MPVEINFTVAKVNWISFICSRSVESDPLSNSIDDTEDPGTVAFSDLKPLHQFKLCESENILTNEFEFVHGAILRLHWACAKSNKQKYWNKQQSLLVLIFVAVIYFFTQYVKLSSHRVSTSTDASTHFHLTLYWFQMTTDLKSQVAVNIASIFLASFRQINDKNKIICYLLQIETTTTNHRRAGCIH